jgi:hypothetical protein
MHEPGEGDTRFASPEPRLAPCIALSWAPGDYLPSRRKRDVTHRDRFPAANRTYAVRMASSFVVEMAAWAAARRAIGTR